MVWNRGANPSAASLSTGLEDDHGTPRPVARLSCLETLPRSGTLWLGVQGVVAQGLERVAMSVS